MILRTIVIACDCYFTITIMRLISNMLAIYFKENFSNEIIISHPIANLYTTSSTQECIDCVVYVLLIA